jgi:hypothetical protein
MVKFEYKVFPVKTRIHADRLIRAGKPVLEGIEGELNTLGKKGWELVGVQSIRLEDGRLFTVAYLKRQK